MGNACSLADQPLPPPLPAVPLAVADGPPSPVQAWEVAPGPGQVMDPASRTYHSVAKEYGPGFDLDAAVKEGRGLPRRVAGVLTKGLVLDLAMAADSCSSGNDEAAAETFRMLFNSAHDSEVLRDDKAARRLLRERILPEHTQSATRSGAAAAPDLLQPFKYKGGKSQAAPQLSHLKAVLPEEVQIELLGSWQPASLAARLAGATPVGVGVMLDVHKLARQHGHGMAAAVAVLREADPDLRLHSPESVMTKARRQRAMLKILPPGGRGMEDLLAQPFALQAKTRTQLQLRLEAAKQKLEEYEAQKQVEVQQLTEAQAAQHAAERQQLEEQMQQQQLTLSDDMERLQDLCEEQMRELQTVQGQLAMAMQACGQFAAANAAQGQQLQDCMRRAVEAERELTQRTADLQFLATAVGRLGHNVKGGDRSQSNRGISPVYRELVTSLIRNSTKRVKRSEAKAAGGRCILSRECQGWR